MIAALAIYIGLLSSFASDFNLRPYIVVLAMLLDPLLILGLGPLPELGIVGAAVTFGCSTALSFSLYMVRQCKIKRAGPVLKAPGFSACIII